MKLTIILVLFIICHGTYLEAQKFDKVFANKSNKNLKIGLVLSGGGAKGLAHIGVLKVLEEYGIKPDYITGTSMGAIVGGLYSLGYSAKEIETLVRNADWDNLLTDKTTLSEIAMFQKEDYPGYPLRFVFDKGQRPNLPSGMIEGQRIHALLLKKCWISNKYNSFADFPIPFKCIGTDIMTGQAMVFSKGNLADALRISMSIPTVFSPIIIDSLLLTDGGVVRNFPVQECIDMGADIIIGSYTGFNETSKPEEINNVLKVLARTSAFQGIIDAKLQLPKTNILIVPDLKGYGPESFTKALQIMQAGEKAARDSSIRQKLMNIKELLNGKPESLKKDSLCSIRIDQIVVSGIPSSSTKLIEELCNIYLGMEVDYIALDDAINKLYATRDYKYVAYDIKKNEGMNILEFKLSPNKPGNIELGINYDNTYGPSVLARYSMRDLIFKQSLFKVKLAISAYPRLQIDHDYYLSKGKKIAQLSRLYLSANKMPNVIRNNDTSLIIGSYLYNNLNYEFGIKIQLWKNCMMETTIGQSLHGIKMKEGMQYVFNLSKLGYRDVFAQARLKINNLDDHYFPTRGLLLNFYYKKGFFAKVSGKSENLNIGDLSSTNDIASFEYQQFIRFGKRFTINPAIGFGFMKHKPFLSEAFYIGGQNFQLGPNNVNMGGINTNTLISDNYIKLAFGLQLKLDESWYVQAGQELLQFIDDNKVFSESDIVIGNEIISWYMGIGISTPVGPIRLTCSHNNYHKALMWSVNLGIPF